MESDKDEAVLWKNYVADRSIQNRNKLFHHYSVWLKKIASTQFAHLRTNAVDWSDCVQNASIALLEAIDRFEFGRGIPFEAFALKRVKGSIINGLPKGRTQVDKSSTEQLFNDQIDASHIEPNGQEFEQFVDAVIDIAFSKFLDISARRIPYFAEDPLNAYMANREEEKVGQAVSMLSDDLQFIIHSHYNHFLTFTQISEKLGLSKARISQLHKEALKKLRHYYENT